MTNRDVVTVFASQMSSFSQPVKDSEKRNNSNRIIFFINLKCLNGGTLGNGKM